jgi:hypothetical protein
MAADRDDKDILADLDREASEYTKVRLSLFLSLISDLLKPTLQDAEIQRTPAPYLLVTQ